MIRVLTIAERNNRVEPPRVITVAAGVATVVFPDQRRTRDQIAARYFQNVGANRLYYSLGVAGAGSTPTVPVASCDNLLNYHGYLEAGQQIDVGNFRDIVSVYSAAGTTVATTLIRREVSTSGV